MDNQEHVFYHESDEANPQPHRSSNGTTPQRSFIPILFLASLAFFFFSFFTISCGGQKITTVKGVDLLLGSEVKSYDLKESDSEPSKTEKVPANPWAIIAFSSALIGAGTFLFRFKSEAKIAMILASFGVISLVVLQVSLSNNVDSELKDLIEIKPLFAYWASLFSMGLAGVLCMLRQQKRTQQRFD